MSTFRFGEFTFDCESRLLLHNGVERHLSPKSQHLLRLLILARPRALSRQELYDELWPSTFVSETNLASNVNEVRRALGSHAQYIRTIHGYGYAFRGEATTSSAPKFPAGMLRCEGENYRLFPGENVVGRAPDARVVLTDRTISRCHAAIIVEGDEFWLKDLGSTNGTYVDGRKIGRTPVTIMPGARIEFGVAVASIVSQQVTTTKTLKLQEMRPRSR